MLHTRKGITCQEIKDLYLNKKYSLFKTGKILGFSSRTIEIKAKECNIKLRSPGPPQIKITVARLKYLYLTKKLSSRKIAKMYNCAYSSIDSKIKKLCIPRRNLASSHIKSRREPFSGTLEEKAYLIGFRIGDLRVRKMYKNSETILVDCGSTKSNQINLIKSLFSKYGRVWISKQPKNGKVQIECGLDHSFAFLLKKFKKFPNWTLKEEVFLSLLAGFVDAEGSFFETKDKKTSSFSIGNYNKILLKQLELKLVKKGFLPRLFMGVKKGYKGKDGYIHRKDYWILSIYRKKEVYIFTKMIKPYLKHKDKIKDLNKVIKNIESRNLKYGYIGMKMLKFTHA